mmetsp:Transcript_20084/g.39469  ORF Transcript_20084/g.39469 Transcript_20084/m.39469 type:complete len:82 (-) Transcript_20084:68-313(-)
MMPPRQKTPQESEDPVSTWISLLPARTIARLPLSQPLHLQIPTKHLISPFVLMNFIMATEPLPASCLSVTLCCKLDISDID